jgi:hypothetical protein
MEKCFENCEFSFPEIERKIWFENLASILSSVQDVMIQILKPFHRFVLRN